MPSNLDATADCENVVASSSEEHHKWVCLALARRRRVVFWAAVALLGFVQAWSHRLLIDHDAVAYLDVGENYARGAWSSAINGFYSPLYSWLMAIGIYLLKIPRSSQATLLHLVNFTGYLGAYASVEFFLAQLIRKEQSNLRPQDRSAGLSEGAWHTLGLGLFLYSTLAMANLSGHSGQGDPGSTPDIFVVVFVFLATGLLIQMQSGLAGGGTFALFGVVLAFGYFAKTVLFPLSFVFMAVAGFLSIRRRNGRLSFLLTPICFVLVAGPWIAVLSHANGRFMVGDAGRLTYRWLVGPRANPVEWGGQTQEGENLVHPPRRLMMDPPIFEFATPVAGTFPLWYGSSYWLEGWKFHFSLAGQIRILRESKSTYWGILNNQKEYLALLLVLVLVQGNFRDYFKAFLRRWMVWLPAIAALTLYALVRVEPRYVAAFLVLLWISLFAGVKLPHKDVVQQFAYCAVLGAVLTTGIGLLQGLISDFHSIRRHVPSEQVQVAEGLRELGIVEGQSLATIGIPRDSYNWARLAGVRVIAEIPTPNVNQYWFGSSDRQEKVRSLFAQAGAVAIVTDTMPTAVFYPESSSPVHLPGWEHIGSTSYFLFSLRTGR